MPISGTTRIMYLDENIAALGERYAVQAKKAIDG